MSGERSKVPGVFCTLPWIHRYTNIGGELQVCCTSEETDNNIRDDHGKNMSAATFSDNEKIMNSGFMKHLRRQMLRGEWPELCKRCRVTEAAGGLSRRIVENKASVEEIPAMLEATEADGHIRDLKVRSLDMRLGNKCNLACRMCNPRSSTGWHREWPGVDQDLFVESVESIKKFRDNEWYKNPGVMEDFKKQLPHLRHVHFAGGEPLLVKEMQTMLQACIDGGYARNIEISYNTNLTVLPATLKTLWPHFRGVKILVSLDAYGPLNDFIRHPAKWSILDRNLRDLDENYDLYGISEVTVMCTIQAYNVLHLKPLYEYMAGFKRVSRLPHLIDLHYPNYYSTQILTPELKQIAQERLMEIYRVARERIDAGLIPEFQRERAEILLASIQFMNMEDRRDLLRDFFRAAESKDKLRNQNLYTLIPEFRELKKVLDFGSATLET